MRPYPIDSPQAAARLLALALIADGHLQPAEIRCLARLRAHERLGLDEAGLQQVLHALCADLIAQAQARDEGDEDADVCLIEPETLARLFGEVRDPRLRRTVLRLAMQAIRADRQLHEGEMRILLAASDHWELHPDGLDLHLVPPPGPRAHRPARGGARVATV